MDIKLINIGFGNIISSNRIVAIVSPESAPIKRRNVWPPHARRHRHGQ